MSEEKRKPTPEEKAKAAAEAKAKAEALRKQKEEAQKAAGVVTETPASEAKPAAEQTAEPAQPAGEQTAEKPAAPDDLAEAKAKAAAAAKAKAAAAAAAAAKAKAARQAAEGGAPAGEAGVDDADAKAKAAAAAKAKAAAAAAAAAKAKAAAGAAGAEGTATEAEAPKQPSKNQPYLDKYVKLITDKFGADVIEASYINELAKEVPTLVIKNEKWHDVAQFLKTEEQLHFEYLSNLHGVDYEDRMEVYYHLYSYKNRQSLAVKVKTNREQPTVASVMDVWAGANWNERETYDLLGIQFPGHTDLRRIMLPDDWVGHPLRKDYVQYDEEV